MKMDIEELKKLVKEEIISEYGIITDPYAGTETLTGTQSLGDQIQQDIDNLINQSLGLLEKASRTAATNGRNDVSVSLSKLRTEVGHAISQIMNKPD